MAALGCTPTPSLKQRASSIIASTSSHRSAAVRYNRVASSASRGTPRPCSQYLPSLTCTRRPTTRVKLESAAVFRVFPAVPSHFPSLCCRPTTSRLRHLVRRRETNPTTHISLAPQARGAPGGEYHRLRVVLLRGRAEPRRRLRVALIHPGAALVAQPHQHLLARADAVRVRVRVRVRCVDFSVTHACTVSRVRGGVTGQASTRRGCGADAVSPESVPVLRARPQPCGVRWVVVFCRQRSTGTNRNVGQGLARGRQKRLLERWTNPKLSRRTCTCEYGLQSWRGESAGVAKRPRGRSPTRKPSRYDSPLLRCRGMGVI
jgi:type IV pilus biogenesis protein CpaD/CtpE